MKYTADELVSFAKKEVGYLEKKSNKNLESKTANAGNGNFTKYANFFDTSFPDFYNGAKNGYPWCDVFVDYLFAKNYGYKKAKEMLFQPSKSLGAGCQYSADYYRKVNRYGKTAKVGSQIFFGSPEGHTGIVTKVDKKYVYTIEGNTSSNAGVVANGGCVRSKKYPIQYEEISGYGYPKYVEPIAVKKGSNSAKAIIGDGVNVRTGAGIKFNVIAQLYKSKWHKVYVISRTAGWCKVTFTLNGKKITGYIASQYVEK